MVEAGIDVAKASFKLIALGTSTTVTILAMVALITMGMSGLIIDQNVFTDLVALVQVWLPFNLFSIIAWVVTASTLFMVYKFAVIIRGAVKGTVNNL